MICMRFSSPRMGIAALVAAVSLVTTSCGSLYQKHDESLVRAQIHGSDTAPDWVKGQIPSSGTELAFVGRGTAFNVLDERKAFDEAFMHAREQLAQYVGTRVTSEACDKDWAQGARFLPVRDAGPGPGEHVDQSLKFRAHQLADSIVGELLPVNQYWEQWDVEEKPSRHFSGLWFENKHEFDMRRYKCWVLTTIPRQRVEKFIDATLAVLKEEADAAKVAAASAEHKARAEALDGVVNAQNLEIQHLRERIHYGRAFRLTAKDNCEIADPCVTLDRPQWRKATLEVEATVKQQSKPNLCDEKQGGH